MASASASASASHHHSTTMTTAPPKKNRCHPHPHPHPHLVPLQKHKSWSPDSHRDQLWLKRKELSRSCRSKSLTDEDVNDLKACFELGFGFDSPALQSDSRLCKTLPALELYFAVNKNYNEAVLKSNKSSSSSSSLSSQGDMHVTSPINNSPVTIISPGDDPQAIKTKLRHWAQVVACSVKHSR